MAFSPSESRSRLERPWRFESPDARWSRLIRPPVSAVRRYTPKKSLGFDRGKYSQAISKMLFFLVNEGPATTMRKIRSVMDERRIVAEQTLVIATIEMGGRRYLGFTRWLDPPLVFDTRLVFHDAIGVDLEELELSDDVAERLEAYLPVPSCPVDPQLPRLILSRFPFLRPAPREPGFDRYRLASRPRVDILHASSPSRAELSEHRRGSTYLLGFGSYVRHTVMPHFRGRVAAALDYRAPLMRRHIAATYPILGSRGQILERIAEDEYPLVIVSTYHSDHAAMAYEAIAANPRARVFLQKPAAVELDDFERLVDLRERGYWIDVGYNRRYAPLAVELAGRAALLERPLVITMAAKELKIPPSHWYFWSNQGTRISGNLSHWIDLTVQLVDRPPAELTLLGSGDNVSLAITFEDGSIASLVATDRGDDLRGVEEQIEVRGGGTTLTVRDFRHACWRSGRRVESRRRVRRDKGQERMFRDLYRRWISGGPPSYPIAALYWTGYLTYHASRMLRTGQRTHEVGAQARETSSRHPALAGRADTTPRPLAEP